MAECGLALVVGGTVLAAATGTASAAEPSDVDIAKLAATAEVAGDRLLHAVDQLRRVRPRALPQRRAHERDRPLQRAGRRDRRRCSQGAEVQLPSGPFSSRDSASKVGIAHETAFIGAYLGAIRALHFLDLKVVAGQICAHEFVHLIVFADASPTFPSARRSGARS